MKRRYVLKRKKRFFIFISVVVFIAVFTLLSVSADSDDQKVKETVTVGRGDTLWSIAEKYGEDSDIRKYIFEIKELNNIKGNIIFEGDELLLP